jgi:hypothetical protein
MHKHIVLSNTIYAKLLNKIYLFEVGQDSVVSIAADYRLDSLGIESQWVRDFLYPSSPALGSTQCPVQWVPGLFVGVKQPRHGFDHPSHLAPKLKKG